MKSFKEQRTDPHRPSVMDPAEYVFVGAADDHPGDSYLEVRHDVLARHGVETGSSDRYSATNVPFYDATEDGRPNFRCHHCGKHGSNIRYFVFFLHKPSKKVIVVGQICAKKLSLGSRDELDFQKRADEFRRMQARHQWVNNHEAEMTFLREYHERHEAGGWYSEFLSSLWDQVQHRGSLSDKQLAALQSNMERQAARQATEASRQELDGDRHKGQVTQTSAEPTEKQVSLIMDLADQLEERAPAIPETRIEASELINTLKARLQATRPEPEIPSEEPRATEPQISFINSLMDERVIAPEKRQDARRQLDAGLTKVQASRWISKLLELPKLSDNESE